MESKFTTDGHTVFNKREAIATMVANPNSSDKPDVLIIKSGQDREDFIKKLHKDLPFFCKENKISEDYFTFSRESSYFTHLNKLR